jgi:hypothetical protein
MAKDGHTSGSSGVPNSPLYELIRSALPEFLGNLGATLVVAGVAWGVAHFRKRDNAPPAPARAEESQQAVEHEGQA